MSKKASKYIRQHKKSLPSRRLWLTMAIPLLLAGACLLSFREAEMTRPNIIFLLADDLRYNSLGCMGNAIVKTPNIDRLAERGTLFKNSFVTSSVCNISRASIFSGQYANRHGI